MAQELAIIRVVESRAAALKEVLPADVSLAVFMTHFKTAALTTKGLADCTQQSIILSCMKAAVDGLMLDGREAALVVHNNKVDGEWVKEAQYYSMVQGLIKRLRNTSLIADIAVRLVYAKDAFRIVYGDDEKIEHLPSIYGGERGHCIGCYSIVRFKDGTVSREFMCREDIDAIMQRSKSVDRKTGEVKGPWATDWGEMARKTVLRRHMKVLPQAARLSDDEDEPVEIFPEKTTPNGDMGGQILQLAEQLDKASEGLPAVVKEAVEREVDESPAAEDPSSREEAAMAEAERAQWRHEYRTCADHLKSLRTMDDIKAGLDKIREMYVDPPQGFIGGLETLADRIVYEMIKKGG